MDKFAQLFPIEKPIIGMIHLRSLPGTPFNKLEPEKIVEKALEEAFVYKAAGIDALMIENMHDIPYQKNQASPEVVAMMAIIAREIKQNTAFPLGIQILAGANVEALSVAKSSGADFIRAESFVFGHIADEGYMDAQAAKIMRHRKNISGENILIFTDIKKKHSSHAITADLDIVEIAKAASFFASDGLIITGNHTGEEPYYEEVKSVKENTDLPVLIGSGINEDNLSDFFPIADAFIVGSYFKKDSYWKNELDPPKIKRFMEKVNHLRHL
jgi:membrane complex biogenesis BtpA family protein